MVGRFIVLALVFVACSDDGGGTAPGPSTDPADLDGTDWQLDDPSIQALVGEVPPNALVTLAFDDGQASGTAACNHYGGPYEASDDGSLSFEALAMTEMACDEPRMALEAVYLAALDQVTEFGVEGNLALTGGGVTLSFSAVVPYEAVGA